MNNENLKSIEKLTPFTKMIMTIGTLPSSFYSSMSYYESMVWLYEYLKNQVIPTVNNNAEAVEELQGKYIDLKDYVTSKVDELETYMNNYFENLDVQEEINNKLDEMAEDGTLTDLIKNYVDPIYQAYEQEIDLRIDGQDTEISNFKTTINNQITEINSKVNSAYSGSPLVASSTAEMTDTTKVYVNTTDGNWYYYDGDSWEIGGAYQSVLIADETIDGKMIYNNSAESIADSNVYQNAIHTYNGMIYNANYNTSDFIPVLENDIIETTNAIGDYLIGYNEDKEYVQILDHKDAVTSEASYTISSATIKYVTLNLNKNYTHSVTLNGKSIITKYLINWLNIDDNNIKSNTIYGNKIKNESIHPSKLMTTSGLSITNGSIWNNTSPWYTNYGGYSRLTNMISVTAGDVLEIKNCRASYLYRYYQDPDTEEITFRSYEYSATLTNYTGIIPANVNRIGINMDNNYKNQIEIYINKQRIYLDLQNYSLEWLELTDNQTINGHIKNYKTLFIGDSITENNATASTNWVNNIVDWFKISSYTNGGMSGTGILRPFGAHDNWYNEIETYSSDYDLILIMGDMNDWSNQIFTEENLGQYGDNTTDTFYGTMKLYLEKILNKYPLAKIGWIISTPRNQLISGTTDYLHGYSSIFNTASNIIEEMCHNYSIPVLNLYKESNLYPWLTDNNNAYFKKPDATSGDGIHPNNDGHLIISYKIKDFISRNF